MRKKNGVCAQTLSEHSKNVCEALCDLCDHARTAAHSTTVHYKGVRSTVDGHTVTHLTREKRKLKNELNIQVRNYCEYVKTVSLINCKEAKRMFRHVVSTQLSRQWMRTGGVRSSNGRFRQAAEWNALRASGGTDQRQSFSMMTNDGHRRRNNKSRQRHVSYPNELLTTSYQNAWGLQQRRTVMGPLARIAAQVAVALTAAVGRAFMVAFMQQRART